MKLKRFFVILFVVLVSYFGSNAILNKLDASEMARTFKDDPNFKDDALATKDGEYLILLVGVDKNSEEDENNDFTRTDTIMLLRVDSRSGNIDLLSIPRDSRIKIRDSFDKVNHAHAFGGIELTMQSIRNFLGLDIDYYVQVNYKALINIIDALGGVEYDVPEGVSIDRGSVKIRPGHNELDGNSVMWLLRTRNIYNNGDIGRVNSQQAFVKAMVDQIVSKSKEINIMTFITNYLQYVKTNLPMSIMMDLAANINNFSSSKMHTYTVPGREETMDGTSYYIPDFEKTWDIVNENFKNFKLSNWKKENSGYEEYGETHTDEDESKDNGLNEDTNIENNSNQVEEAPIQYTHEQSVDNNPVYEDYTPQYTEPQYNYEPHYSEPDYDYSPPQYIEPEPEEAEPAPKDAAPKDDNRGDLKDVLDEIINENP